MHEEIMNRIQHLFKNYLYRDLNRCEDPLSEHIFGEHIGLLPSEGYYLLTLIEHEFAITFPQAAVTAGKFNLLSDIIEVIDGVIMNKKSA